MSWNGNNELYSVSDDMSLWRWSVDGVPEAKVCGIEVNATDMHWFPIRNSRAAGADVFVLSCTDGPDL